MAAPINRETDELYHRVVEVLREHPGYGRMRVSKLTGGSKDRVTARIKLARRTGDVSRGGSDSAAGAAVGGFRTAVPADEFVRRYDVPEKIREGLQRLHGMVIRDADFRAEIGVAADRWRRAADLPEFDEYRVKIKGKLYWAQPQVIEQIELKLSGV